MIVILYSKAKMANVTANVELGDDNITFNTYQDFCSLKTQECNCFNIPSIITEAMSRQEKDTRVGILHLWPTESTRDRVSCRL